MQLFNYWKCYVNFLEGVKIAEIFYFITWMKHVFFVVSNGPVATDCKGWKIFINFF